MPHHSWQDRVKGTAIFHKNCLRGNNKHTIRQTANLLNRSIGSITEDLLLSSWMETHSAVEEFSTMCEALEYIRTKKLEMRIR